MRSARVPSRTLALALSVALLGAALPAAGAAAQASAAPTTSDPIAAEALQGRREATRQEIAELRERRSGLAPDAPERAHIDARLQQLRLIDSLLSRALDERRALDASPDLAPVPADAAEPSIGLLIELYEEIDEDAARLEDLARAIEATRETSDAAASELRDAERARREARDAWDARPTPENEAELSLARLRSRAAQEEVHLRALELRGDRTARESLQARIEALETRARSLVDALRSAGAPGPSVDADLAARETEIERHERQAQRELEDAERRLQTARARLAPDAAADGPAQERVEALQRTRDLAAQKVAAVEKRRERLEAERELRAHWLALVRGDPPGATVEAWREEASARAESARRSLLQLQGRLADLQERSDDLERRLQASPEPALREALEQRRSATEALIRFTIADVADLARHERIQRRLLRFLQAESGDVPLVERIASAWSSVASLWRFEITTVDDEPITVGNALLALLLFGVGFSASRRIAGALRGLLDARFQLEPGVAGAAQTAVFYVLLVTFGLLALRTVNFPLTAFTVAGGALAIGIGFGSQNVMNNFISGLILMLERPVRSNDLIEVENTHGVIEQIGARSTRIRATDGRHLIVPNSFFLENNVVNWTLSDDLIRAKVSVGVIYGSPTRLVEKLIRQALDENPKVLDTPEPIIVFSEFGDNSLNFDAYFWTRARGPMAVYRLGGEMRFRIDDLFREHGLVIAFPQRDVHLDSASPIEVRVLGEGDRTERPAPPAPGGRGPTREEAP